MITQDCLQAFSSMLEKLYQESVSWRIRKVSFCDGPYIHIIASILSFSVCAICYRSQEACRSIIIQSILNSKVPFYVLVADYQFFYFYIKIASGFLFACVFVPTETRRCEISLNWSSRWWLPNIMVLGIESRFLTMEPSPAMILFLFIGPRSVYLCRFPENDLTHVLSLHSKPS